MLLTRICSNKFRVSFLLFIILIMYQNCGRFDSAATSGFSSLSVEDQLRAQGKTLYTTHCASCHSSLESSAKANRSQEQITNAIKNISSMQNLNFLTSTDIEAIAVALSPELAETPLAFQCDNEQALSPTPLRKLSKVQYINTLISLFGEDVINTNMTSINQIQSDANFEQPDAYVKNYYQSNIENFFKIAQAIANTVNSDVKFQSKIGGTCLAQNTPDQACWAQWITNFGLKSYRRPLTSTEQSVLTDLLNQASSKSEKISALIETLLQSPYFLYQVEEGVSGTGTSDQPIVLSNYEIASRMSYMIWDSMPDETLFNLAKSGQLTDPNIQKQQVDRMFESTLAREKVKNFALYWLNLNETAHAMRDFPTTPAAFVAGINPVALKKEVVREALEYVDHIVFNQQGSYRDLMSSAASFARTDDLANIYGHAKVTTSQPATMANGRSGLLMRPLFMANTSAQTSPIIRGVRLNSRILCQDMVAPGVDVTTQGPNIGTDDMLKTYSTRERTNLKTADAACIGCHGIINPYGFVFERFDSFGRFRDIETNYHADGSVIATHAINTNTELDTGLGPQAVSGPEDFMNQLASNQKGPSCLVRQEFRFYHLQSESETDKCVLGKMYQGLENSNGSILNSLKQYILATLSLKRVN